MTTAQSRDVPVPAAGSTPPRPSAGRRWTGLAVAGAALVVAVPAVVVGWRAASRPPMSRGDVGAIVDRRIDEAVRDLEARPPDSVAVYDQIVPPLVVIQATGPAAGEGDGLGTGVVVNADGAILTALHVVEGAASIEVTFSDGTKSPATTRSSDPKHDVAVLAAEQLPDVVVPAILGGGARIGESAFAVGHPLGLVGSLSAGVISGLDRSFTAPGGRQLQGLIQFDAAVNPGSSGGPLLNRAGQVIGIVTGLANPGAAALHRGFTGVGFAVPIGTAGGTAGAPAK